MKKHSDFLKLLEYQEVKSWRTLMSAFKQIMTNLEKGLMAEGCSVSRFQILFYLYFEGSMPAVEIARKLVVTRGNISMFLRRMNADGLVKQTPQSGQKRPAYTLTPKGISFFESIFPSHIQRVRKYAPKLDSKVLNQLKSTSKG